MSETTMNKTEQDTWKLYDILKEIVAEDPRYDEYMGDGEFSPACIYCDLSDLGPRAYKHNENCPWLRLKAMTGPLYGATDT